MACRAQHPAGRISRACLTDARVLGALTTQWGLRKNGHHKEKASSSHEWENKEIHIISGRQGGGFRRVLWDAFAHLRASHRFLCAYT